jgi:glycine cleavage system aminomethyltransferase T
MKMTFSYYQTDNTYGDMSFRTTRSLVRVTSGDDDILTVTLGDNDVVEMQIQGPKAPQILQCVLTFEQVKALARVVEQEEISRAYDAGVFN